MKKYLSRVLTGIFAGLVFLGEISAAEQSEITVVRGDENYPPFEMMADGKLTGLHIDMANAAAASIGVKVNWKSVPWGRALQMVETGKADGVTYIARTPEREVWGLFVEDNLLSLAKINFIVLKESVGKIAFDGNLAKFLEHRTPIVVRGFKFGNDLIDKGKKFESTNMKLMIEMLKAKRSDIALVNWNDFVGAFQGTSAMDDISALSPPVAESKNYIAFSKAKGDEGMAKRFGIAMKAYKASPAYGELLKRYNVAQ